jgi:integrase
MATVLRAAILGFFSMARENPALTPGQLDDMAKRYLERIFAKAKQDEAFLRPAPREREKTINSHAEMIGMIKRWVDNGEFQSARVFMDDVLAKESASIERGSEADKDLCRHVYAAKAEVHRSLYDELVAGLVAPPSVASVGAPATGESLDTVRERFIAEYRRVKKRRTIEKYEAYLRACATIIGRNVPMASIGKPEIRMIKETLEHLPRGWTQRYPGLTPQEAAKAALDAGALPMAPGSVNAYLGCLSSLFTWAEKQGYTNVNPVLGIRLPDPVRASDKRDPFDPDHLRRIFSSPTFTGMKSAYFWKKSGQIVVRDARYWLPLIGLFSGMRLGEILNLRRDDVGEIEGHICFRIREAKTRAGVRMVPIHSELIALGFLDHFEHHSATSTLLPEMNQPIYSKVFRRHLDSVGIDSPKLVFHSFRHTFIDALRATRTDEPVLKALVGHSDGTVTSDYGSGYPVSVLAEALNKVEYHGIDFSILYIKR